MTTRLSSLLLLVLSIVLGSCDHIDNKAVPPYTVRINLADYGRWNTYGVAGMGDYRIFDRDKRLPAQFPYDVNTFTGYGGVLLMMGIDGPLAYDLACPVEVRREITLHIDADKLEAICSHCGSRFNPLTGLGGPLSGVAINNKLGMRQYHVTPMGGGYMITN